jgi:hypothetical protein
MHGIAPELMEAYASLFVHYTDDYALQQRDGSYWRMATPLSLDLVVAHLAGRCTLGTYLLDRESTCAFAVFDADDGDGLERLARLLGELAQQGIPTVLEASRRGGHLWVHLVESTPARVVRAWLLPYAIAARVEFYPKQEMLAPGGSGSLIRMPLGIHRQSRGWYPFLHQVVWGEWVPVGETVAACCAWVCEQVERVVVPLEVMRACSAVATPTGPEALRLDGGRVVVLRPGPGSIRAWCRSEDIVAVIGRYVALDWRGVGSCPFKAHHYRGDVRPSFQVFGGDDPHWYCYTWRRAGDLFDFLCLYHQITPQEAWVRLREGTLW